MRVFQSTWYITHRCSHTHYAEDPTTGNQGQWSIPDKATGLLQSMPSTWKICEHRILIHPTVEPARSPLLWITGRGHVRMVVAADDKLLVNSVQRNP